MNHFLRLSRIRDFYWPELTEVFEIKQKGEKAQAKPKERTPL